MVTIYTSDVGAGADLTDLSIDVSSLPWIDGKASPTVGTAGIIARIEADGANWLAGSRVLQLISDDPDAIPLDLQAAGIGITTGTNQDLQVVPNGTGITQIGDAGAPVSLPAVNDNFFVSGEAEVAGYLHAKSRLYIGSNYAVGSGTSLKLDNFAALYCPTAVAIGPSATYPRVASVVQGADNALVLSGQQAKRTFIFTDYVNRDKNHATGAKTDPTVFGFSVTDPTSDATQWWSITHDQTRPVAAAGKGSWSFPAGLLTKCSTANVSNPPTDAELDTEFGTPATVGAGFMAVVDDNAAGTNFYLVASDGANWWQTALTKAV